MLTLDLRLLSFNPSGYHQKISENRGTLVSSARNRRPIDLVYVPGKLIVSGNATATAENLRAAESLLRVGIWSELFHQALGIFLVLALWMSYDFSGG